VQKLPELIQTGVRLVGGLVQGLMSSIGSVVEAAGKIVGTILQTLWELPGRLWDVGVGIVQGIWKGITESLDWIKNKISEWVGNVTQFIMHLFGINSPSKLFRDKVGKPLAEGIGVGFSDEMKNVTSEMKDAIPTNWDVEGNLNSKKVTGIDEYEKFTYTEAVDAFKEALSGMTVEMDDENMGRFIRKTVSKAIYA
jgi:phage-related protein